MAGQFRGLAEEILFKNCLTDGEALVVRAEPRTPAWRLARWTDDDLSREAGQVPWRWASVPASGSASLRRHDRACDVVFALARCQASFGAVEVSAFATPCEYFRSAVTVKPKL